MCVLRLLGTIGAAFIANTISGCDSSHSRKDVSSFFASMESQLAKTTGAVTKTEISAPLNVTDYPLITEVCNSSLPTPNYRFNGDMMRIKVVKHAYEISEESQVYRHEYAVCFGFYPPGEAAKQEVAYVKFLAGLKAGADKVIGEIKQVSGGVDGLLFDSKFNIPLNPIDSKWSGVTAKEYSDETQRVQFLKMSPLEMSTVNKYDADKYKDLLAFEFVYANVSKSGNDFKFEEVQIAVVENAMQ